MEQLLPLLIGGIIWLAYTYYGKGQKKQNPAYHSDDAGENAPAREPSILEQILMGQEIRIPEPEPYYELEDPEIIDPPPVEIKKRPVKRYGNAFLASELMDLKEEGQHAIINESTQTSNEIILLEEDFDEPVLDEDFDIKKAIIYEAVLNPPYIDFK